jgi:ElaB/YqjD/DUF883 family membrane-anchored ribosome-binding protein
MIQQKSSYPYGQGGTETVKDRLRDVADTTSENAKDAASSAQDMAGKVADQAREYADQAQEAVKQVRPYLEKSLKEKPMATLAGVAALAFVLGALWKK